MMLTVQGVAERDGSIVIFRGADEAGDLFLFGAEHRAAGDIVRALLDGESPTVEVSFWQVLGSTDAM